jgi:hypothetical protein
MDVLKKVYRKEYGYEMATDVSEEFRDAAQSSKIPLILDKNPD